MNRYIASFLFLIHVLVVGAAVEVTASAPSEVEEGQQFRLQFVVNTQDISDFSFPELTDFSVDYGPSRSSQSSFSIVNGKTTQSSSVTFTYTLSAIKKGTFTIPAATVVSGGKQYKSNTVSIKVVEGDPTASSNRGGSNRGSSNSQRMRTQNAGENITGKDLFITVTADKQRLYEQEAVLLTYKVYSLVNLTQLTGGIPDLEGFHTQEIDLPQQKSFKMEMHNGRRYGTVVWRQYVLFPQRSGKMTIPSIKFEGVVLQQNRSIDPIDAFFNGGSTMTEVKKTIVAPELTLDVSPLPSPRPDNYSGAVGRFNISSSLTPSEGLKANDALTLRVTVSGSGNMKLMKAPVPLFPKDFETYDAKITDKTKVGTGGVSGNKVFDFIAVPRHAGSYSIPAVEFTYFDTSSKTYKTISADAYDIEVAKGEGGGGSGGNYVNREDVELLGSDIRYIRQGGTSLRPAGAVFYGKATYWWAYVVILLIFVGTIVVFRKQAIESANVAKMRGKKAGKVAVKRLKRAAGLLKADRPSDFYDEVLKALWGYVGDKLNISISELNKDNVSEKLRVKGLEEETLAQLFKVMNDCEFARFAQGDPSLAMDKIYAEASDVINKISKQI